MLGDISLIAMKPFRLQSQLCNEKGGDGIYAFGTVEWPFLARLSCSNFIQSPSRSTEQQCEASCSVSINTCPVTALGRKVVQPFRPFS